MQERLVKLFSVFILLVSSFYLHAQQSTPSFEVGGGVGALIYQGDLTPQDAGSYKTPGFAAEINGSKILNSSFSVRLSFIAGRLRGNDSAYSHPEYRRQRNFKFSSPLYELSGALVWNILAHNYNTKKEVVSPYLFAGIGVSAIHVKRDFSSYNAAYFSGEAISAGLVADQQHSLPSVIPVIPIGAGVRYSLSSRIDVYAESGYRFTFTDYLDGFSKSVNPAKKDAYQPITTGIVFKLGIKDYLKCPPVPKN